MLRLKCLGGLTLDSDDVGVPAAALQRRRLALLLLLVRAREKGMTRDRLMALLWPEADVDSARHALDQLLYATRRDLGKAVIVSDGLQLRVNEQAITSDATEFEQLLDDGNLPAAIDAYAGPFVDGVHLADSHELEHWIDGERNTLHEKLISALEKLAASTPDAKTALRCWKQRMAVEPFSSAGALSLMQAYVGAGDHAAALRYAENYQTLLRVEVGAEPSPEFLAYCAQLATEPRPSRIERLLPQRLRRNPMRWAIAAGVVLLIGVGARAVSHAAASPHTPDAATQKLYMQGRILWNTRSREGLEQAVVMFRKVVERDPLYAEAHAALAESYALLGYHGFMPTNAAFPKAKAAAQQALALDAKLGAGYTALGLVYQWENDWHQAERALQRAIEYAPSYATAHQHYALLLRTLRRHKEAANYARRAADLDPLSIQINNTYAIVLAGNGALDSARSVYDRIVTSEPDTAWVRQNPWVLSNFAGIAATKGEYALAHKLINRAIEVVPGHPRALADLAGIYIAQGDTAAAMAAIAQMDQHHPLYPAYRAFMDARLGQVDSAFAWFDRVRDWSPMLLMKLNTVRPQSRLYSDPRYAALQQRFRLPR